MGFEAGDGVGVATTQPVGPIAIHARGEVLKQDKVESPGWRLSGLASVMYGKVVHLEGGVSWRKTRTNDWTKTGWSPFVGAGWTGTRASIGGRYFLPDNTVNKTGGFQVQVESRSRPYVLLRAGLFEFDQAGERLSDETFSLGVGWRW